MSKGAKVFVAVLYYLIIIVIGIFLAMILPNSYYYQMPFDRVQASLDSEDFSDAIRFVGEYYDNDYVKKIEKDDKGLVIFASTILEENSEGVSNAVISKAYVGFLYHVSDYNYKGNDNNQTKLIVTSSEKTTFNYSLLSYDSDSDGTVDAIGTLSGYDFIYFQIREEDLKDIDSLKFIDKDGESYFYVSSLDLDFNRQFFIDVNDFCNEYNADYNSPNLTSLGNEFLSKDDSYKMCYYDDVVQEANKKAKWTVLIYFIIAYIIGDCLVGKRFLINAIIKLINKIKKKDGNEIKSEATNVYHDYYSQVTYTLKVPSDCEASFLITYHNEQNDIEFRLTKEDNYTVTQRIHAGVYVNAWLEENGYKAVSFPKKLEVSGYKKTFTAEFIKDETIIDENNLENNDLTN